MASPGRTEKICSEQLLLLARREGRKGGVRGRGRERREGGERGVEGEEVEGEECEEAETCFLPLSLLLMVSFTSTGCVRVEKNFHSPYTTTYTNKPTKHANVLQGKGTY